MAVVGYSSRYKNNTLEKCQNPEIKCKENKTHFGWTVLLAIGGTVCSFFSYFILKHHIFDRHSLSDLFYIFAIFISLGFWSGFFFILWKTFSVRILGVEIDGEIIWYEKRRIQVKAKCSDGSKVIEIKMRQKLPHYKGEYIRFLLYKNRVYVIPYICRW